MAYQATEGDFFAQPKVADAASELLRDVFGEDKLPVGMVLGVAGLPLGVPVVLEVLFEFKPEEAREHSPLPLHARWHDGESMESKPCFREATGIENPIIQGLFGGLHQTYRRFIEFRRTRRHATGICTLEGVPQLEIYFNHSCGGIVNILSAPRIVFEPATMMIW